MRDALEQILVGAILSNGIPHADHSDACHEADAKLVRAALAARPEALDYEVAADPNRFGEPGEPYQVPVRSEPGDIHVCCDHPHALPARSEPPTDALRAAWGEGYRKGRSEPGTEGLDVERLAEAIHRMENAGNGPCSDAMGKHGVAAAAIAREYAALAETEPKP